MLGFPDRVPCLVMVIHSLDLSRTIYDNGMCIKYLYTWIVLTNVFQIGRVLSRAYATYGPEAEPVNAYDIYTDKR